MNNHDSIFNIAIENNDDGIINLIMSGLFVFNTANQFEEIFEEQVRKKPKKIGLDCANVVAMDSSAIYSIRNAACSARDNKIKFCFLDISSTMQKIFHIMGVEKFFKPRTQISA